VNLKEFTNRLNRVVSGQVLPNEPLKIHSSWKIGGAADVLFIPDSVSDLRTALKLAADYQIPVTVIGNGTNVLILDGGIEGLVVKLTGLKYFAVRGERIVAAAGVSLPYLTRVALNNGLTGLEFAVGIPGSVGGAIVNNAGAHGSSMQKVVDSVTAMDMFGRISLFDKNALHFGYRTSLFKGEKYIVLRASICLRKSEAKKTIEETMERYLNYRKTTQPVGLATAGCVFTNPPEGSAGYFIEKAGFKGYREGDAQVSTKHANFIVNRGNAKAADILRLIEKIKKEVFEKFGVHLVCEIQVLGRGP